MFHLLDGVRVVELGHILLAPYATQFLGDFGADVIKVEAPEGDYYRRLGVSRAPGMTAQWMAVNRNKRSIALDLKSAEGRAVLLEMLAQADVVVHNMRVPAIERLGLGYENVRAVNPRIVYCAAIGFGQGGPYADLPAFDDLIQARSGLAEANGRNAGAPAFVPMVAADKITGLVLGQAITAGLFRQRATGEGCYIETPMFETMVSVMLSQHLSGASYRPPEGGFGYARVMSPFRKPARTRDGFIAHGVYKFDQWQRFLRAVGRDDVVDGPMMTDPVTAQRHFPELYEIAVAQILPQRTTAEWQALFDSLDIPNAPVVAMEDLPDDPHIRAVGLIEDYDHPQQGPMRRVRSPYTMRGVETGPDLPAPALGAQGAAILGEFGLSPERIARLIETRVLAQPATAAATPAGAARHSGGRP
ncbi:CaiB/BaiF CoA-transferase family protein [Mesorhizobium sp. J428]|uniref:CaiB/BaiF CoA transferase family protein n=1 Tax=Mesorhizobium sp. J428 TaxID=2898440 RepID=UPI0021519E42|nr:CoA transferase [Mesorhizobium sp. J428]MCR5860305.1 CoA transferase [Mesorhizobium sp. J428]